MYSLAHFEWLFAQIQDKISGLQYYKGSKSQCDKEYQKKGYIRPGPSRKLCPRDETLLTLMKVRMNLLHGDLAHRFNISLTTVSSISSTWIPFLGAELKCLIRRPDVSKVLSYYPACFEGIKGKVFAIID